MSEVRRSVAKIAKPAMTLAPGSCDGTDIVGSPDSFSVIRHWQNTRMCSSSRYFFQRMDRTCRIDQAGRPLPLRLDDDLILSTLDGA